MPTLTPSVRDFLRTEASSAVALLVATVVALVWANSAWADTYDEVWGTTAGLHLGSWSLELTLHAWVNDAAMAVFFAVVGLEIAREATRGELRDRRSLAMPALGALGGLLVPALIFIAITAGTDVAHGWGVVMSTDTAFLVGILALFGPACPDQLRLFLLTLAIVDDIGAITVMAVAYTSSVDVGALALAGLLVVALLVLRWMRVWRLLPYVLVGVALWLAVQASGVHATLAGVLVGLVVPATATRREEVEAVRGYARDLVEDTTAEREHLAELAARAAVPAGDRLQRALHPWSAFVVVPLFGLANAGVVVSGDALADAARSRLTIAVVVALVVGNAVGITGATTLALRLGLGELPGRVRYGHLLGGAVLAGIGFTISLFIAELAFDDDEHLQQAKIGILAGSLVAAVLGSVLLRWLGERLPLCSPPSDPPPALPPLPWRAPGARDPEPDPGPDTDAGREPDVDAGPEPGSGQGQVIGSSSP
ncbi:Na+/H+ antiporter NhaA [Cellulomonas composti]|uniref:Na(+)/H(+) antiporter NhaA n=1 Tax=Cellulomonas composti TaxID=266130 RepID=A0A511JB80_9CELL|nr:Na+/H+ antiporter NhaA [Cellulomonas composti]GEL95245.1 Na(+)/H(+) antiporter NhaA [Cellulomonas composti]